MCAGLVDQLSDDSQQQVEDSGEDGDTACKRTDNHEINQLESEILKVLNLLLISL